MSLGLAAFAPLYIALSSSKLCSLVGPRLHLSPVDEKHFAWADLLKDTERQDSADQRSLCAADEMGGSSHEEAISDGHIQGSRGGRVL